MVLGSSNPHLVPAPPPGVVVSGGGALVGTSSMSSALNTNSNNSSNGIPNHGPIAATSNQNGHGKGSSSSTHTPVMYRVSWSTSTPALTITLLVPKRINNNNSMETSPFNKVQDESLLSSTDDDDYIPNSKNNPTEKHVLRIPLSYLLSLSAISMPSSSENGGGINGNNEVEASWLDRPTLRNRLNGGGRAIGLEPPYLYQAMAAVEETAARLPEWVPNGTEGVSAEVVLLEGRVTLLASVSLKTLPSNSSHSFASGNSSPRSQQGYYEVSSSSGKNSPSRSSSVNSNSTSAGTNSMSNSKLSSANISNNNVSAGAASSSTVSMGSVLNETSGGLMATAPSFPPPGVSPPATSSTSMLGPYHLNNAPSSSTNTYSSAGAVGAVAPALVHQQVQQQVPHSSLGLGLGSGVMGGQGHQIHQGSQHQSSQQRHHHTVNQNQFHLISSNSSPPSSLGSSNIFPQSSSPWLSTSSTAHHQQLISQGFNSEISGNNFSDTRPNSYSSLGTSPMTRNSASVNANTNNASSISSSKVLSHSPSPMPGTKTGQGVRAASDYRSPSRVNNSNIGNYLENSNKNVSSIYSSNSRNQLNIENENSTVSENTNSNVNQISKPDPSSIVAPLLAMGFTEKQCNAAVAAIRNVSTSPKPLSDNDNFDGSSMKNSGIDNDNSSTDRDNTLDNEFINNINGNNHEDIGLLGEEKVQNDFFHSHDNGNGNGNGNDEVYQPDQLSGEDILDYVLNSGGRGINSNRKNKETEMNNAIDRDASLIPAFTSEEEKLPYDQQLHHSEHGGQFLFGNQYPNHVQQQDQEQLQQSNVWGASAPAQSSVTANSKQQQEQTGNATVWGNAGKLKLVKSVSVASGNSSGTNGNSTSPTVASSGVSSSVSNNATVGNTAATPWGNVATSASSQQSQKMVKVLDVPPEMNAFVFHCNAQTRDECLERGLFGCPSGGQYGPHSKAKAGDLLFLADFSAWTVTGIFTAKADAGLNLERTAWGGRFPWQIRLNEWSLLRTVHIDKVNEILGLASGSKLNMLTKEQLVKLVISKEFGPCVPSHLYKMKPATVSQSPVANVPAPSLSTTAPKKNTSVVTALISTETKNPAVSRPPTGTSTIGLGMAGIRYQQQQFSNNNDEHPATAMHRLKLVTAWFDCIANEILTMNEMCNNKKPSRKDSQKDKLTINEELTKLVKSENKYSWPLMTYSHVRKVVGDIFDQWLYQAHAIGNEDGRARFSAGGKSTGKSTPMSFDDSGSWTRQGRSGSSNGKKREDPVLLSHVPGADKHIQKLLVNKEGPSALCIPSDHMAKVLASKIIRDLEQIATEVRKTQASLIRIGGDDYLKSVEDKALGMRLSEVTTKYYDDEGEKIEKTIMRIEWHTKSSIAQGRPPQVQKIYKTHFDMLGRKYDEVTAGRDPDRIHLLTRMFVLLCRYDLIGDFKSGYQAPVPPMAFESMSEHFGVVHECFANPLHRTCSSYNSIFPDIDRYFGSLGSFFDFVPTEGSFEVNPPFNGGSLKMMFDHIFGLLQHSDNDKNALSFLIIVPETNETLECVNKSQFFRRTVVIERNGTSGIHNSMMGMQHKETGPASRKISKNIDDGNIFDNGSVSSLAHPTLLIWLQNDFGHDLWTPTDSRVQSVVDGFNA